MPIIHRSRTPIQPDRTVWIIKINYRLGLAIAIYTLREYLQRNWILTQPVHNAGDFFRQQPQFPGVTANVQMGKRYIVINLPFPPVLQI